MIVTEVYSLQAGFSCPIPLFSEPVEAGFPSPADDYIDCTIDLNEHLIKNPPATFMVRVRGNSMVDAGIQSGDLLIIDKSLDANDGDIVIEVPAFCMGSRSIVTEGAVPVPWRSHAAFQETQTNSKSVRFILR